MSFEIANICNIRLTGLQNSERGRDYLIVGAIGCTSAPELQDASRGALAERPMKPNWCGACGKPLISMQFPTCNCGIPLYSGPIADCADERSCRYRSLELIIDDSFGETFCDFHNYFTLIIEPGQLSVWQAPNQVCSRGVFHTEADAHEWARVKLNGAGYSVRFIDVCEDVA